MKSKRSLMTMVVGLAMLATPIAASANDHNRYDNSHAARVSRSFTAPARDVRAAVTRREFHNNEVPARRDWREDRRAWGNAGDYRNYGNPGYRPAPGYVAAPAYPVAAPYYGVMGNGGACSRARGIVNTYYHDRNTGHPAAAASVLAQNQWAFRSGCGRVAPIAGGLLGGMPAYGNNGGYGQPYGTTSMLTPLIQQFVR